MFLTVRHRVRSYEAWRPVFDEHRKIRVQYGCRSEAVFRHADDPDEVVVVCEFPDRGLAMAFTADPTLQPTMAKAGVLGMPVVTVGEQVGATEPA